MVFLHNCKAIRTAFLNAHKTSLIRLENGKMMEWKKGFEKVYEREVVQIANLCRIAGDFVKDRAI